MRLSKSQREQIRMKFNGLCAYSGTPLEDDWEVDHVIPVRRHPFTGIMERPELDTMENLVPCQRAINNYKHSMTLDELRSKSWLGGLHIRLGKLPKNPRTPVSENRKSRMLRLADYFGITRDRPFVGVFYFEKIFSPDHTT